MQGMSSLIEYIHAVLRVIFILKYVSLCPFSDTVDS